MKHSKLTALVLAASILTALCACGGSGAHKAVRPDLAQSGGSAAELSLPDDVLVESAGGTASLYELKTDRETAVSQIKQCLGIDLSEAEKEINSLGTTYIIDGYKIDIESDSSYWSYTMLNAPPSGSSLSMTDDEALEIAEKFVKDNDLWSDGTDNVHVVDQMGLLDDGTEGVYEKSVFFYPQTDGRNVLGVYRIMIGISLDGTIVSVYHLINPVGEATTVELKSRDDVAADIRSGSFSASPYIDMDSAKIIGCKLGYYADAIQHGGKTYLFPVYILTGEGTNMEGNIDTFDIIIDAQK